MIRSVSIALLMVLAAAGTASAQTATVEATAQAQTPDMVVSGETAQDDRSIRSRTCLRSTGSRIALARNERAEKEGKPQRCVAANGKVYTRSDLDSTGMIDIADALRMLDPAIR